ASRRRRSRSVGGATETGAPLTAARKFCSSLDTAAHPSQSCRCFSTSRLLKGSSSRSREGEIKLSDSSHFITGHPAAVWLCSQIARSGRSGKPLVKPAKRDTQNSNITRRFPVSTDPLTFDAAFTIGAQIEARAQHPVAAHKVMLMHGDRSWTYR